MTDDAGVAGRPGESPSPREAVTSLYQAHAVAMIRLAVVMLGDQPAAEDVVQDAFCGLYRRWGHLTDATKALTYLRSAVLNGCRSRLRYQSRHPTRAGGDAPSWGTSAESPESAVLNREEHRAVLAALQRLPERQRETLVLRFYQELPPSEVAVIMGISLGTVKSATARGLAALGRLIGEQS